MPESRMTILFPDDSQWTLALEHDDFSLILSVIPAKAGIPLPLPRSQKKKKRDPRLRGDDGWFKFKSSDSRAG